MTVAQAQDQPARSYYGQPVIKEPIWTPEIPAYFFTGGLAGASAGLAFLSELTGDEQLARRAWAAAMAGIAVSPALLISDLGVPTRFLNMLRMFKVTSPMSVGSWILSLSGATTIVAAANAYTGRLGGLAKVCKPLAALLGLPLSTYTAALIANTAVPVWHGARDHLPAIFASGAAASAGAAAVILTPVDAAGPARRLAVLGAVGELVFVQVMEQRLEDLADPYHHPEVEPWTRAARLLTATGALVVAGAAPRHRAAGILGGVLVSAGAVAERFSVFRAGFVSAREPQYTVGPQRRRIVAGLTRGAARRFRRTAQEGGWS